MLRWQINAKPLIEATPSISKAERLLKLKKSLSMLSLLKGIETIKVKVDAIRAPIAAGLSLKTYLRFGKKLSAANTPKKISLNDF
jgi:hypothetical protein